MTDCDTATLRAIEPSESTLLAAEEEAARIQTDEGRVLSAADVYGLAMRMQRRRNLRDCGRFNPSRRFK